MKVRLDIFSSNKLTENWACSSLIYFISVSIYMGVNRGGGGLSEGCPL